MADLQRHVQMIHTMGLGSETMCNIHVGGSYGNKEKAGERFITNFMALPEDIREHITLENDDKTFTAFETLDLAEQVEVPMVLDIHHHNVNNNGEDIYELWPRIMKTWVGRLAGGISAGPLPPKIHVSSPKGEKDSRSHADYVEIEPLISFLREVAPFTEQLDIMIEAKMKDAALFRLMKDFHNQSGVKILSQASIEIET
ncbi:putative UV damage endonuclease [compost metagenome]